MRLRHLLTPLILLGLVAGCLFGEIVLHDPDSPIGNDHWTRVAGDLVLIRPLMLMIIPLVFFSVVAGVCAIGDPSRLGLVGGTTILYYLVTMLIAVSLGALLVTSINPGDLGGEVRTGLIAGAEAEFQESGYEQRVDTAGTEGTSTLTGAWMNILRQMVPTNVVDEMARGRTLGVIIAALFLGLGLAAAGDRAGPARDFFTAMFHVLMRMVGWIIWLTPIGVFLLVAWSVGKIGFHELFDDLARYILTVLLGLVIHGFVVLPLILLVCARTNPWRFMWQMRQALLTAFGTDSSSATLPVTINSAIHAGGCSRRASNFVLPLGATINMDGTALYEAVAVVFLFQVYGIELSMSELLIVIITATLAAIGAAGIPSAGLITMVIVISAVNTSLAGRGEQLPLSAMGIIIGVDRIVDMCRTTVNVWGDAVGARIMTRLAPD